MPSLALAKPFFCPFFGPFFGLFFGGLAGKKVSAETWRVMEHPDDTQVRELYRSWDVVPSSAIFACPPDAHGMGGSLDRYVARRLPADALARPGLERVLVLGVHPEHLAAVESTLALGRLTRVPFSAKPRRQVNWIRPTFHLDHDERTLVVAVPPGRAYLKHYASLVAHQLARQEAAVALEVRHFPDAASSLADWTGLSRLALAAGTTVVGHVDEIARAARARGLQVEDRFANEHLSHAQLFIAGRTIDLVAFAFSFWGDIAGRVAGGLYDAGADEVIYFGKVGALSRDVALYDEVITPVRFMRAESDRIRTPPFTVPNRLAAARGGEGLHVSVPTVLEQGHTQLAALRGAHPRTIDNEITYMAEAARSRLKQRSGIAFSSISFATDYVRPGDDPLPGPSLDLSNNREPEARAARAQAMASTVDVLLTYLRG